MKKTVISLMVVLALMSSCGTAESGAVTGASLGGMFGSALGGLLGGRFGSNVGTMVGMIAGGATGAGIGHQNEKRYEEAAEARREERRQRHVAQPHDMPASGPERIEVEAPQCPLALRNLRFIGEDGNQAINRGETCKIVFELANVSGQTVYDVVPYVAEINGNEHLDISPTTRIESINAGDAIRYTATLQADERMKDGTAVFRIAVSTDNSEFFTLKDFSIATDK